MLAGTVVYVYAGTQLGQFRGSTGLVAALALLGLFPLVAKMRYRGHEGPGQVIAEPTHGPIVSIVMPALDDAPALRRALDALGAEPRVELIVVNGGRPDAEMIALERERPRAHWIVSAPGRGRQMNEGARNARGTWLLFLHADTHLAPRWVEELEDVSRDPGVVGGSFRFQLDDNSRWARAIERGVSARVRWGNLPYGDQALFVRREVFVAMGGYAEWPLMEDVDFVRRLRPRGRLHHSALPAVTSARRWRTEGWIRRSARNIVLLLLFFLGVSPARLAAHYAPRRRDG